MSYEKSISFRSHLQSNTVDILAECGIECTHTAKLVTALVSRLAAYTEEGTPLSPSVFICNSVTTLVRMSGAGEHVPLSTKISTSTAAGTVLKAAAPLCSGVWNIFIERLDNGINCRFGVFCGSSDPSSSTVDEALLKEVDQDFPIIRVAQNVTNKVEVRTNAGGCIEFRFNDDADNSNLDNNTKISVLAAAASSNVEDTGSPFCAFMERMLVAAIRDSHGTLIAVTSQPDNNIPQSLSDGVPIAPPLDLLDRFQLHLQEERTAVSVSRLQAAAELLAGFINSDGITVLTTDGKVVGYRAFIRSEQPTKPSEGGARTRAYVALCELVGTDLKAAFFRSQDGRMELKSV